MNPAVRANLRDRVIELLNALDAGDDARVNDRLQGLADMGEGELISEVSSIVHWMRAGVDALSIDQQLSRAASTDLPDLVGRLDAVIQSSEAAALRTLDLVEQGQAAIRSLGEAASGEVAGPSGLVGATVETCEQLRGCFAAIAEAQSYQDLNGQTIKKAIGLLGGVEDALVSVLRHAGVDVDQLARAPAAVPSLAQGTGPRVAGLDAAGVSQSEADDLLADLGL